VHVPDRRRDDAVLTASFAGKVAIVTGGAGGMGRATAAAFAAAGAKVAVSDITAEAGEETAAMVRDAGGDAVFVQTDVADAGSVVHLVDETVSRYGGLHCAVNAAAIELERVRLHELEDEVFDRIIAVNLRSIYLCMKHEVQAMLAGGAGGSIVNIASTNSVRPQPHQSAYTASKHGVIGMTRNAAVDYAGDGIRINAVCPGFAETAIIATIREGLVEAGLPIIPAEQVTDAVVELFDGDMTGECWYVQAGRPAEAFGFRNIPGPRAPA
jgi:NAD(P)-dependent dehydrogenase (short-subunit alcohol dehydrogenase family)